MEELLKKYKEYKEKFSRLSYVLFILGFDCETDCPKDDREREMDVSNYYQKEMLDLALSDDYKDLVYKLYENKDKLDEITKKDIEIEYKDLEKQRKVPKEELYKHLDNLDRSSLAWHKARETGNYSEFKKELEELVSYLKRYCVWQETPTLKGYDVLLDEMEEGYNQELYDSFFNTIEQELVPYI